MVNYDPFVYAGRCHVSLQRLPSTWSYADGIVQGSSDKSDCFYGAKNTALAEWWSGGRGLVCLVLEIAVLTGLLCSMRVKRICSFLVIGKNYSGTERRVIFITNG